MTPPGRPKLRGDLAGPRLAVLSVGVSLSLSVGLLEMVEYALSSGPHDPVLTLSLWRIIPDLGLSVGIFLLAYLLFWFLIAEIAGRVLRLSFGALLASSAVLVGLLLSILLLSHHDYIPRSSNGVALLLLICGISFLPAAGVYRVVENGDRGPAGVWRLVAGWGAAGPLVLTAIFLVVRLLRRAPPHSLLVPLLVFLGIAVAVLLVWLPQRLPRAIQIAIPLAMFLAVSLLTLAPRTPFESAPGASRPLGNPSHPIDKVILISVDALRASALSCYDPDGVDTPNICGLARDGILFRNAISAAPWTLPSFSSIMTGLSPSVHRATHLDSRLPDQLQTLAEALRADGYLTAAVGRNPFLSHGLSQGFDQYGFFPKPRWRSLGFRTVQELWPESVQSGRNAQELTRMAIGWLGSHSKRSIFFWLHYYDPHLPYQPPARYLPRTPRPPGMGPVFDDLDGVRRGALVPTPAERAWIKGLYDGEVRYVDDSVGELLRTLERLGIYDDALIIFTSDHGEEFWEHGGFEHGHTLYNEVLHVPLIVKLPGSSRHGEVSAWVSTQSLTPTVESLCGLDTQSLDPLVGPLAPHWKGLEPAAEPKPIISTGLLYYADRISLIDGDRKYIHWIDDGRWQIYDLRRDPGEQEDLAFTGQEERDRVTHILDGHEAIAAAVRARLGMAAQGEKMKHDDVEMLKALGYVR